MYGVFGIASSRVPGTLPGRPISGLLASNVPNDVERNALRRGRIVLCDVGPKRRKIGNRLRRPDWLHELFGVGFSSAVLQEATQSFTDL
jgi:hypothetical protein